MCQYYLNNACEECGNYEFQCSWLYTTNLQAVVHLLCGKTTIIAASTGDSLTNLLIQSSSNHQFVQLGALPFIDRNPQVLVQD